MKNPIFFLLFILTIFFTAPHFWEIVSSYFPKHIEESQLQKTNYSAFDSLTIEASSAIVYDIKNDTVLYNKNSEAQLPLASLTKVMTALVAKETSSETQEIIIEKDYLKPEGDSGLLVGDVWNINELIRFTLLTSSNDGARSLAGVLASHEEFVETMNTKARNIGMEQTYFLNSNGLDIQESFSGNYGSARDVAKLFSYVLKNHPSILEDTAYLSAKITSQYSEQIAENTNTEITHIPALIASKTGFTDLAGGNLAVVFEAGPAYPIAVVVLGSTREGRFKDVENLTWATLHFLHQNT